MCPSPAQSSPRSQLPTHRSSGARGCLHAHAHRDSSHSQNPSKGPREGGGDGDMRRGVNPGTVAKAASQYWAKMGKSHTGVESDFKMN